VGRVRDRLDPVGPAERTVRDRLRPDLDHLAQQPRPGAHGQPAGDLLAVGGHCDQHRGRRCRLDQRSQHVDFRGEEIGAVGLGQVDLLGAVLRQGVGQLARRARGRHHHRGRLAQRAGRGEQLVRALLDLAVQMVDQDQHLSHVLSS